MSVMRQLLAKYGEPAHFGTDPFKAYEGASARLAMYHTKGVLQSAIQLPLTTRATCAEDASIERLRQLLECDTAKAADNTAQGAEAFFKSILGGQVH